MAWYVILCSIGYIDHVDVPNKGIEQACSWASCDTHIRPFSINGSQLAKMKKSIPDMSLP